MRFVRGNLYNRNSARKWLAWLTAATLTIELVIPGGFSIDTTAPKALAAGYTWTFTGDYVPGGAPAVPEYGVNNAAINGGYAQSLAKWTNATSGLAGTSSLTKLVIARNDETFALQGGTSTVYYSTDYGDTWSNPGLCGGTENPAWQDIHPTQAGNMVLYSGQNLVGGTALIRRRTFGGSYCASNITTNPGGQIAYRLSGDIPTVFVGTGNVTAQIYSSNDFGSNWAAYGSAVTGANRVYKALNYTGTYLYAATNNGIQYSTDNGSTWNNSNLTGVSITNIEQDAAGYIWGISATGTIYKSSATATAGATSYSAVLAIGSSGTPQFIYADPTSEGHMYMGTTSGQVYRMLAGTTNWVSLEAAPLIGQPSDTYSSVNGMARYSSGGLLISGFTGTQGQASRGVFFDDSATAGDLPYIQNTLEATVPFTSVSAFSVSKHANHGTDAPRFQISNDGISWYYNKSGLGWLQATGNDPSFIESNTESEVNDTIADFDDDIGPGNFYFRMLLLDLAPPQIYPLSNGEAIDSITITYVESDGITITNPTAADSYTVDDSDNITWTATGSGDHVRILLYRDSGATLVSTLVDDGDALDPATGTWAWDIGNVPLDDDYTIVMELRDGANATLATDTSDEFSITFGALDNFLVSDPGAQTVDVPFDVFITARDQFNNTITDFDTEYVGSTTLTYNIISGAGNGLPASVNNNTFVNGVATVSTTIDGAGEFTITAAHGGQDGTSPQFAVGDVEYEMEVLIPNGPATSWAVGTNQDVTWTGTTTGDADHIRIDLSDDSGATYDIPITASTDLNSPYSWAIDGDTILPGTTYRIRLQLMDALNNVLAEDESDADFVITYGTLDHFVVDDPGAQTVDAAFDVTITALDAYDNVITDFDTEYVGSTTLTYNIISGAGNGLPASVNNNTFVNGVATVSTTIDGAGEFTITAAHGGQDGTSPQFAVGAAPADDTIALTYPEGGETLTVDDTEDITWNAEGDDGAYVIIELTRDSGTTPVATLVDKADNVLPTAETWEWVIGNVVPDNDYRIAIRLMDAGDNELDIDTSANFTITAGALDNFLVAAPDTATTSEDFSVTVTARDQFNNAITNFAEDVDIVFAPGPGTPLVINAASFTNGVATINNFNITADGLHTITASFGAAEGEDTVTVSTDPTISVQAPNGGEEWERGEHYDIAWSPATADGDHVRISLSANSGVDYDILITESTDTTSPYDWRIPSTTLPGETYRIKLELLDDEDNVIVSDESNADFAIIRNGGGGGGDPLQDGPPKILSIMPPDGSPETYLPVGLYAPITITFSKPMNQATVNFTITSLGETLDSSKFIREWTNNSSVLTLTHPELPFYQYSLHEVSVQGKDLQGNSLVTGLVPNPSEFTTILPAIVFTEPSHPGQYKQAGVAHELSIKVIDQISGTDYTVEKAEGMDFALRTSSPTGNFALSPTGPFDGSLTSIHIPTGENEATLYFMDTWASYEYEIALGVTEEPPLGWIDALTSIIQTVDELLVPDLGIYFSTGQQEVPVDTFSQQIKVEFRDKEGGLVNMPKNTRLLFRTSSSTGLFYRDINGTKTAMEYYIGGLQAQGIADQYALLPESTSSFTFYYKDSTAGNFLMSVFAPETEFQHGQQMVKVIALEEELLEELPLEELELTDVQDETGRIIDRIEINPSTAVLNLQETAEFQAVAYDTEGNPIENAVIHWFVVNGGGTILEHGTTPTGNLTNFTAGTEVGEYNQTVLAATLYNGQLRAVSASVIVVDLSDFAGQLPSTGPNQLQLFFLAIAMLAGVALAGVETYEKKLISKMNHETHASR